MKFRIIFLGLLSLCSLTKAQVKVANLKLSIIVGTGIELSDFDAKRGNYQPLINSIHYQLKQLRTTEESSGHFSSSLFDNRFTRSEKLLNNIDEAKLSQSQRLTLSNRINDLGIIFNHIGDLKLAEKFLLQAMTIRAQDAGKKSEYYVSSLLNLAAIRKDQGRYNAAEDILKYVVKYYSIKTDDAKPLAIANNNMAMLYAELGRIDEALLFLKSALATELDEGQVLLKSYCLLNLGLLYGGNNQFNEAEAAIKKALILLEQNGYTKHPIYLKAKLTLSKNYLANNELSKLEPFINDVLLDIDEKDAKTSLNYASALEVKAAYYFQIGDIHSSLLAYDQVASVRLWLLGAYHKDYLRVLNKVAVCHWLEGSNNEAYQKFRIVTSNYLKVVNKFFFNMSEKEKTLFWENLKPEIDVFYSFVMDQSDNFPNSISEAFDLRIKTKALILTNTNRVRNSILDKNDAELETQYKNWIALKEQLSTYYNLDKEVLKEQDIDITELEAETNEMEKILTRKVSSANTFFSDKNSHLISEKLGSDQVAIEIIRVEDKYKSESARYIALLLFKDRIELLDIGDAIELEARSLKFYNNAIKNKITESMSYENYWSPIQTKIENVKSVIASLDGVYNLINLNTLHKEGEDYLIDKLQLSIVNNTAEILNEEARQSENGAVVLIGDPSFNSENIAQLPGTGAEVAAIEKLMPSEKVISFTSDQASEESLKSIKSPRVLHIATHGFFDEDNSPVGDELNRSVVYSNPLIRSGLLLSGAGKLIDAKDKLGGDGVFTAFEAMNLDLHHTELVALSACETGNGEVVNGEGVYGLSRSFQVAGADKILMSLWKVDDEATKELMTSFYSQWLSGLDLEDAFIQAQKEVKTRYPDPYYWGAFVLMN